MKSDPIVHKKVTRTEQNEETLDLRVEFGNLWGAIQEGASIDELAGRVGVCCPKRGVDCDCVQCENAIRMQKKLQTFGGVRETGIQRNETVNTKT
eukprot:UN04397